MYPGDPNLRCYEYPEALHPVARYVNGILALKEDKRKIVFGAITGIPLDLSTSPDFRDWDAILADDRMQEEVSASMPNQLNATCSIPGRGVAFPGRRYVELARALDGAGAGASIQSICQESYRAALDDIIELLVAPIGIRLRPLTPAPQEPRYEEPTVGPSHTRLVANPPRARLGSLARLPAITLEGGGPASRGYLRCGSRRSSASAVVFGSTYPQTFATRMAS